MKNFVWWIGVVEDRDDPERLGRCRVRIFGYHTDDINLLPTGDLPWAIPIQPVTSASISGLGATPVGLVPGAWVTGWFLDGEDAQQPIILGTIPGKPELREEAQEKKKQDATEVNVVKDSRGSPLYEQSGNLIYKSAVVTSLRNSFAPLSPSDIDKLFSALSQKLSSGNLGKVGEYGELGKYQISISNLINLGYLKASGSKKLDKTIPDNKSNWTGLNNVKSKQEFLSNSLAQEEAMLTLTKSNYDDLIRLSKISEEDDKPVVSGLLASAHVFGVSAADDLERKDFSGRQVKDYFNLGVLTFNSDQTNLDIKYKEADNYLPEIDNGAITNEDLARTTGFSDPEKKYPKYEYQGLSDVNKLALGDTSHLSFKIKKAQKTENIQIARSTDIWEEPDSAYKGNYPYNQVIETEAGHVIELDSTPNAERIHIFHKKGTYIEIDVNGTMVRKVLGDNYEILDRNNSVYIKGANDLTVEGRTSIYVKDDAAIEVDGDVSVTGHKNAVVQAAESIAMVGKNVVISGKQSVNIISDGSINLQSAKDTNINAKGTLSNQAGGTLSIKAGVNLLMDALLVKTQMGANAIRDLVLSPFDPPERRNPSKASLPRFERKPLSDDTFSFDAGEPESDGWAELREKDGEVSTKIVLGKEFILPVSYQQTNGSSDVERISCEVCNQFQGNFPRSFKLSKNFLLRDMLVGSYAPVKVQPQRGLTSKDIVCNMMQLAENCLEPIKQRYPNLSITNGLRSASATTEDGRNLGVGDHGLGAAADLQFSGASITDYIDIANWCVKNIPYRQLLLEFETYNGTDKFRTVWIHVSLLLDKNGNIIKSRYPAVQTMKNHRMFVEGIISAS